MRFLRKLVVSLVGGLSLTYLTVQGMMHMSNAIRFFLAGYNIAMVHIAIFVFISWAIWSAIDAKA